MSTLASGWARVKFGDVVRNRTEAVPNPKTEGLDRTVGLDDLDGGSLAITRSGSTAVGTTFTRRFDRGHVLFGKRRAYQRKVAVAEFSGVCSGDILVFEAIAERLCPELLPFIVQSDRFFEHALRTSRGSLSPRTSWRDLGGYEFELPPLPDQKRLADLLWSQENLLVRWRATQDALHQLSRALEERAFGSARDPNMVPCGEVCALTVGIVVRPASYYVAEGIPAIRSLNVLPNHFDLSELVYISAESNTLLSKSQLHVGDVVVVRSGRPGDAAAITPQLEGTNCIDLIIVRPGPEILPEYLCRYLNSRVGRSRTSAQSAGTAQQHLNVGALAALRIPVPAITEQQAIVQELSAVDKTHRAIDEHLESTRTAQKALSRHFLREQRH